MRSQRTPAPKRNICLRFPGLQDLRICSAQQPVCFSARKRTCGQVDNLLSYVLGTDGQAAAPQISIRLPILPPLGGRNVRPRSTVSWQPAASPFHGWPPAEPPRPSAPALTGLLVHWPQLQTLVVAEQSAFRTSRSGKDCLVAPASLEELVALQPPLQGSTALNLVPVPLCMCCGSGRACGAVRGHTSGRNGSVGLGH